MAKRGTAPKNHRLKRCLPHFASILAGLLALAQAPAFCLSPETTAPEESLVRQSNETTRPVQAPVQTPAPVQSSAPVQTSAPVQSSAPSGDSDSQQVPAPSGDCAAAKTDSVVKTSAGDRTEAKLFRPFTTQKADLTTPAMQTRSKPPKLGLALGGGGARGAAEIGVLKVLMAEGIKFDCVTGTSVGSVIGGFYCMGASAEDMERVFVRGDVMRHFMTVPLTFRIIVAPVMLLPKLFGCREYDGLYKGNIFRKFLMRNMDVHVRNIEDLPIPFAAVALNLIDGRPYMLRKGCIGYAMQASCAVPALRQPVEIEGELFADGGVICNLPVKQCRELGADIVIAVNIDEPFEPKPLNHFRRIGSVSKRLLDWALFDIDEPQARLADITIHPNTAGISLISTRRKDAVRGVKAGEDAARELLPQIRALLKEAGIPYGATAGEVKPAQTK